MRVIPLVALIVLCLMASTVWAQQSEVPPAEDIKSIAQQLQETRSALAEAQQEIQQLRHDLDEVRQQVKVEPAPDADSAAPTTAAADQDPTFLAAKISELHQDKVESSSKYPVKISGLILFNSFLDAGNVAASDLPILAFPRPAASANGSIGATLSQTLLGIDAKGPQLFGAQTSANVSVDFAGGNPPTQYGVTAGLIRLRTANAHLQWTNASLTVGQDGPFFSPLSPTSYATVAQPGLSWAGNLWVWTPQAVAERRIQVGTDSALVLQGGLLDPLTEEIPPLEGRSPGAGELTRVPAIAGRIAYEDHSASHPFSIGLGGYRAKQRYESFSDVDSWTVNTDIKAAITRFVEISGEGYKGQAAGGLGGGIWSSAVFPEASAPHSAVHALRSVGGWGQLKLKPVALFEVNAALGQDENYASDLHLFPVSYSSDGLPAFQKNQARFINFIYTPRSALLFALEYRHLRTTFAGGKSATGDQINLAAGVHF